MIAVVLNPTHVAVICYVATDRSWVIQVLFVQKQAKLLQLPFSVFLLRCCATVDSSPVPVGPCLWRELSELTTRDLSPWPLSCSSPVEEKQHLMVNVGGKELELLSSPSATFFSEPSLPAKGLCSALLSAQR